MNGISLALQVFGAVFLAFIGIMCAITPGKGKQEPDTVVAVVSILITIGVITLWIFATG